MFDILKIKDIKLVSFIVFSFVSGNLFLNYILKMNIGNNILVMPLYFYIIVFFFLFIFGIIFNRTDNKKEVNRYFYKIMLYGVILLFFYMTFFYSYILLSDYSINVYMLDSYSLQYDVSMCFFSLFLSLVSFLFFLSYIPIFRNNVLTGVLPYELLTIMLLGIFGMYIILFSNDLLIMLVGLELLGLSSYLLAGFNRMSNFSSEGSLKYFILGAVSSSLLMLGCCLIYGEFGVISFTTLAQMFEFNSEISLTTYVSLILLFSGLLFKLGAVPYYSWLPDVYEGSPFYVTSYFLVLPKISIFGLIFKLVYFVFFPLYAYWSYIFLVSGVLSVFIGVLGAIKQVYSLRRFFAYTSISHSGYMLLTLSTPEYVMGLKSLFIYLIFYTFLTLLFFSIFLGFVTSRDSDYQDDFGIFREISYNYPIFGIVLMTVMLSFIGIPFFSGFFMKYFLLYNVLISNYIILTLFILIFSTIAGVYYIRILINMYYSKVTRDVFILPLNYQSTFVMTYALFINVFSIFLVEFFVKMIDFVL